MSEPLPPTSSIPGAPGFDPEASPKIDDPGLLGILNGTNGVAPGGDVFKDSPNAGLVVRNGGLFDTEKKGQKDPLLKISDVMWRFYRWSDDQVRALARKLAKAGFQVTETSSRDVVWANLYDVLMEAAKRVQALGEDAAPTVDQILQGYMRNPVGDVAGQDKPESYTSTSTHITDPSSAKALVDKVLAQELGRDPTEAEKAGFLAALNSAERANPVRTTQELDKATGMYLDSTTEGGIDAEEFAKEWVDDDETRAKERGDYQMATTYFDALLGAIQSPVG